MRPLIGITLELRDGHLTEVELSLRAPIERLGGTAIVLPRDTPLAAVEGLLDLLDGVLLSGGADVDPAHYGADRHALTKTAAPAHDAFELALARRALERELPILGVCRGAQVLAVADGGVLVQDVETLHPGAHGHTYDWRTLALDPPGTHWHEVVVEPDTAAERWFGEGLRYVNSFHHQSVARTGARLRPTVRSLDGAIEATEHVDGAFAVGLQWHNELMWRHDERFLTPHLEHVEAARRRAAAR